MSGIDSWGEPRRAAFAGTEGRGCCLQELFFIIVCKMGFVMRFLRKIGKTL